MTDLDALIGRLEAADRDSVQRMLGSRIFAEAAAALRELREAVVELAAERDTLQARLTAAERALREIKDTCGKVCEDFELCTHVACNSSYGAWAIADEALSAAMQAGKKEQRNG
jgi:hypothetical protein